MSSLLDRLVRTVAVVLVFFGGGLREAEPKDAPPDTPKDPKDQAGAWPTDVSPGDVYDWWNHRTGRTRWARMKHYLEAFDGKTEALTLKRVQWLLEDVPSGFAELVRAGIVAPADGLPPPVFAGEKLLEVARELADEGIFDPWAIARIWRAAARSDVFGKPLVDLLAELSRQARLSDALTVAAGGRLPMTVDPGAWRTKGGGPRPVPYEAMGDRIETIHRAAKKAWPTVGPGTWRKDGLVTLTLAKDSPRLKLVRGGKRRFIAPGGEIRFGRLDLLEALPGTGPAVLVHDGFGKVEIPSGSRAAVWHLPELMSEYDRERVELTLLKAMHGDEAAAEKLERALPLTHAAIRRALDKSPDAKGAPRLRMILALWDR